VSTSTHAMKTKPPGLFFCDEKLEKALFDEARG
jgi:hypothetical protein